jgi:hypothetical protein
MHFHTRMRVCRASAPVAEPLLGATRRAGMAHFDFLQSGEKGALFLQRRYMGMIILPTARHITKFSIYF